MNITNKGKKIVNIGELVLLPGKTAPLPKNFEGNPVVGFLIERGTLSCDQPFCSAAPETPLNDDAADDTGDDAGDDTAPAADDVSERIKAIKKMNRLLWTPPVRMLASWWRRATRSPPSSRSSSRSCRRAKSWMTARLWTS